MIRRIKAAWRVLCGKVFIADAPKVVYVKDGGDPERWVQLCYYRDDILALDGLGRIWQLRAEGDGNFVVQILLESPKRY